MEYLVNILFEQILSRIEEESKIQDYVKKSSWKDSRMRNNERGAVSNIGPKNSNGIEYTLWFTLPSLPKSNLHYRINILLDLLFQTFPSRKPSPFNATNESLLLSNPGKFNVSTEKIR